MGDDVEPDESAYEEDNDYYDELTYDYEPTDYEPTHYRAPRRPVSPRLRKCRMCGAEFFEIKALEPCPSCGIGPLSAFVKTAMRQLHDRLQ